MGYPTMGQAPVVRIFESGPREITVSVNGKDVGSANYEDHGWSGLKAVADMAKGVALACGADVRED